MGAFSHGMTVATNALLEGRGVRTAHVLTAGFTDIVELGRQNRSELYRLCAARPAPLVGPELRFGAPERTTPEGPLREPAEDEWRALARRVAGAGVESVAVTLLHSYRHPGHELALRRALEAEAPGLHVSLSHEVVGTFREYERAATTEVDAALSPLLGHYLRRLLDRAEEAGLPEPSIMQSNGGLIDAASAAEHASWTVLSGPAGGAAGAAFVAATAGVPDVALPRHGRDVVRCLRGRRRRRARAERGRDRGTAAGPADARGAHGRRRWRLDRVARSRRSAARRAALGRSRPGSRLLRPRRDRADGHRREPGARLPRRRCAAGGRRDARPRLRASGRSPSSRGSSDSSRSPARRGSSASPTRRWSGRCGW